MEKERFTLNQLQNWMQGMLIEQVPVNNGGHNLEDMVNASKRLSAVNHLDIYRRSYIARLRACMKSQFAALNNALGDGLFQMFADQFLDNYPSHSYTLNNLGERFPMFLEKNRPDKEAAEKENWPDFIIGLAKFEYALSEIFDELSLNDDVSVGEDAPDESLKIAPVIHLFEHQYPVCQYYLDFCQGRQPDLPLAQESFCAVTRRNYKLGLFVIHKAQYYFLAEMKKGSSVSEAQRFLSDTFGFPLSRLYEIWPQWKINFISSGFFSV